MYGGGWVLVLVQCVGVRGWWCWCSVWVCGWWAWVLVQCVCRWWVVVLVQCVRGGGTEGGGERGVDTVWGRGGVYKAGMGV